MAIKKLFSICIISFLALGLFLTARAPLARAAQNDTITVNVSLNSSTNASDTSASTSVTLKKGDTTVDTKLLASNGTSADKETFNPVTFSNVSTGSYKVCVDQTDICQTAQKGSDPLTVNLNGTLTSSDANNINQASSQDVEDKCYAGVGPLSFVLCPAFSYMQKTITFVEKDVIAPFLEVPPLTATNKDGSAGTIYAIWQVFRTVADGLFIIIFLVIIFAQTTSLGLDSLTIKRMLPRLVAAAILVQFSFLICSLAVDITNILGRGLGDLINGIVNATGAHVVNLNSVTAGLGVGALAIGALAFAGSVISGAIFVTLLGAFFGILGVFLTLVARQIIITLLIILSPLAFLMWVLPNTQDLFEFWRRNFLKVLIMYPLIVLLFIASKIVAIAASASGGNGASSAVASLIGLAAAVAPLFLIPATFRFAGSMMLNAHGFANRFAGGARGKAESTPQFEKLKNWSDDRRKMLAAGVGVTLPGSHKEPVFGGKTSGKVGRVLGGGVLNAAGESKLKNQAARTRSLLDLRALQAAKAKEMEASGLDPDGYKMVSRGLAGAEAMIADAEADVSRKRLSGAPADEIEIAERKVSDLKASKSLAERYFGNRAAQAAALLKASEMGMLGDEDRKLLAARSQSVTGQEYGKLIWKEARFKAGEGNPVISATTLEGEIDLKGVVKGLEARPPAKLAAISKDGWQLIASLGLMDKIPADKRNVLVDASSNNPTSTGGANVIIKYQEADAVLKGNMTAQGSFLAKYGQLTGDSYELLNDKALLGGLISDGSDNGVNARRLRADVRNELLGIASKADFAARIEGGKPVDAISDDDWEDFKNYRDYWTSRVDHLGRKL